jgi:ribosome maturation factor RimP
LIEVDPHQITIEVDGGEVKLPFDAIHKARLAPQL